MLVREMADALITEYTIQRRKSLKDLKIRLKLHLLPALGALTAAEVSAEEVECYITERQEEGAANATINRELAALKRMYKLAARSRKIALAETPYIPHLKESNVRKGFVPDKLYDVLVRETGKIGLWLRAMFEISASYGMRKAELTGLKVRQVNFDERKPAIMLNAGETKNDAARLLPLSPHILELIKLCIAGKGPDDYIFTRDRTRAGRKARKGGHIADMRDAWEEATKAAGCPGLLFHDLRRTGVRTMRRLGVDQATGMEISGHKTPSVYQRYNIIDRADLDDAVAKIEKHRNEQRQINLFESGELFPTPEPPPAKKPN
jgi:integrase